MNIISAMKTKETIEEFTARVLSEVKVDVDINYCIKHGVKFKNHEIDANGIELFNSKANKAAFDLVFKNR
jgi:hypothetical protein